MNHLDEIFDAIRANLSVEAEGDHIVELLDSGTNEMIVEIDGEQYLIQKR